MYRDFADKDVDNSEYYSECETSFSSYVQRLSDESRN